VARKTYGHSDQTFQAIVKHEAEIALEMDCEATYIYAIKNRDTPDPYPKFRELFRATVRGGGNASFWLDDLNGIYKSAEPAKGLATLHDKLFSDVNVYADAIKEIVKAVSDGTIDEKETRRLIRAMEVIQKNVDVGIDSLHVHLSELSNEGKIRSIG